jgi:hypothetical protein
MKPKIDKSKLTGEGLWHYYTYDCPDKEYSSVVCLLLNAATDLNEIYSILERCEKEKKKLIAFYPAFDNFNTSKLEYIGPIIDGGLYMG